MKKFLILVSVALISFPCLGQKEVNFDGGSKPSFLSRVYVGGGFGFSSNSQASFLSLSPVVGYMLTRKLSAGVGVTYEYYNDKFFDADDHRYGGKVFLMQMLVFNTFLYGEYNFINLDPAPWDENIGRRTWDRVLVGGGLSQPMGRASFNIIAAYDVTHDSGSPYASPWVISAFISI